MNWRKFLPWIFFLFLFATNHWYGWNDAIRELQVHDASTSYQKMIDAAPAWPAEKIAFHHAQRFIPFYGLSLLAKFTHIPYEIWFRVASIFLVLASAALLHLLLRQIQLPWEWRYLFLALWILNPYAFRYYLAAPVMVADLFFVFGMLLAFCGLVKNAAPPLLIGLIIAVVSRQTALLLLPTVVLWLVVKNRQYIRAAISVFLCIGIYIALGKIVSAWSESSVNTHSVVGIYYWLSGALGEIVSARAFFEHCLRVLLPLFLPLGVYLFFLWKTKRILLESVLFLLAAIAVAAQPFLAGPIVAGGNAGRLAGLGIAPLLVAAAFASKNWIEQMEGKLSLLPLYMLGLAMLSFHHSYSALPLLANPTQFVIFQMIGGIVWLGIIAFATSKK